LQSDKSVNALPVALLTYGTNLLITSMAEAFDDQTLILNYDTWDDFWAYTLHGFGKPFCTKIQNDELLTCHHKKDKHCNPM